MSLGSGSFNCGRALLLTGFREGAAIVVLTNGAITDPTTSSWIGVELLGPQKSFIGATAGWHVVFIDAYGFVWDTSGSHEQWEPYLSAVKHANRPPASFEMQVRWKKFDPMNESNWNPASPQSALDSTVNAVYAYILDYESRRA